MPARPHPRHARPPRAHLTCSWDGCGRAGQGDPPLCRSHAEELEDESDFEETIDGLVDGVLGHPQVQRLTEHVGGLLDQLAGVIDQVKRGDPRRAAPIVDPAASARALFHFSATEVLTRDKIRERKHALATLVHPDHGGSADAMARINHAAEILNKTVT